MNTLNTSRAITAAALLLCGCSNNDREELIGPCVVLYNDPLFTVERVRSAATGAPIPQVFVSDVTWNTAQQGVRFLVNGSAPSRNVAVDGERLRCDVSCGFGSSTGTYRLTFQAPGFRDTTLTIAAAYTGGGGNCPAILSNGVRVTLDMQPR